MLRTCENRSFLVCAFLLSALCTVMYAVTPFCDDDLWYTADSYGKYGSWEYFASTVSTAFDHWQWDVGRLSNMAATPFIGFFPKWVFGIFTGLWIFIILILGVKITKINFNSPAAAFWIAVILFVIPWFDSLFTVIYAINYIWAAGLGLVVAFFFLQEDKKYSRFRCIVLFLTAVCLGWWHEGLSVPLICAFFVYKLILRKRPSAMQWAIFAGLFFGISIIVALPAFRAQTEQRQSMLLKSVWWESAVNLSFFCLGYLYLFLLGVVLCCKRLRTKSLDSLNTKGLHAGISVFLLLSFCIFLKYFNGARTGMFAQLVAALGIISLTKHWLKPTHPILGISSVIAVTLLSAVSLGAAIKIQLKLTREIEEVRALADEQVQLTGQSTVFYDITPIHFGIDLLKPTYKVLNTDYGARGIRIFPSDLKGFRLSSPEIIHNSDSSIMIFKNHLLMSGPAPKERLDVFLKYEDGSGELSRTRIRDFVTEDGDTVAYIFPHSQALGSEKVILDAKPLSH